MIGADWPKALMPKLRKLVGYILAFWLGAFVAGVIVGIF
jgi:hypothetical protein